MKSSLFITAILILTAPWVLAGQNDETAYGELLEKEYLYKVTQHLYRWYLDETDVERIVNKPEITFWVRSYKPPLDKDDKSLFGEVIIPDLNVKVTLKKSDYTIEELDLIVKHDTFRIINVARGKLPTGPSGYKAVSVNYQTMRDYLHRTRNQARFPEGPLLKRMRMSAREAVIDYLEDYKKVELESQPDTFDRLMKQDQIVYFSPFPDVANEVWAFWETGRMLIRFSSDIDLENPAMWDHDELTVKLYDIDEQTVVSLDEVAGSNAYMTRDQVGRALYNCIVLGRRMILQTSDSTSPK